MSEDYGRPIHYTSVQRGTPVYDSEGVAVGEVRRVEDNYAEHILDGFIAAYEVGMDPEWHDTLVRIARERLGRHRDLDAVAMALREVPRSLPFDGLAELEALEVPALVVASLDEADPGHPHSVATAWSTALPRASLISEEPGESPLAWQGGRLSREIAAFSAGLG